MTELLHAGAYQSHQKDNQKDTKKTPKRHQIDNVSFWCLFGEMKKKNNADLQHHFESNFERNFESITRSGADIRERNIIEIT